MITETYKITKNNSEIEEMLEDGNIQLLREELGLPPVTRKEAAAPFKFRPITKEEMNVFKILFPKETLIENYKEFIPEEVLQEVADFKQTCPFRELRFKVMSPKDYDPDPVMVCDLRDTNDEYSFANKTYLIARWGDALKPFEQLKEIATNMYKKQRAIALKAILRDAQYGLTELEDIEMATLDNVNMPSTYNLTIK